MPDPTKIRINPDDGFDSNPWPKPAPQPNRDQFSPTITGDPPYTAPRPSLPSQKAPERP